VSNSIELFTHSPADLPAAVPPLLAALAGRKKIALYGEMGAGKTALVGAWCAHLGVPGRTASPTFSLVNEYRYPADNGKTALFRHLDLYRLNTVQEAFDIGIEDFLYDSEYCIIEWPQLIESLFPKDMAKIKIEIIGETARRILIL
jgi:tRNA threonylcarbamoyladenosine biosynthesis protein TsaE